MGFRLSLLILFFLALGLLLRSVLRRGGKASLSGGYVVLGHLAALLIGLMLSPAFLSVIDQTTKSGLIPILEMAFGWVGFLFGFQFNISTLRRVSSPYLARAVLESLIAFLIIFSVSFVLLIHILTGINLNEALKIALALGAVLSISSPTLVGVMNKKIRAKSPVVDFLSVVTSIDGLTGLAALGLINISWHPAGLKWFVSCLLILILGIGQAFLIWLLLRTERKAVPTTILGIGVLTLGAGMSAYLGLAPVVPGALAGMIAANLAPGLRQRLARMLVTAESGLYFGLVVLAGVFLPWRFGDFPALAVVLICSMGVILRFVGKSAGAGIIYRMSRLPADKKTAHQFCCSVQSGGALILVAALCYNQTIAGKNAPIVLLTALAGFIFGEIISIVCLPRLLHSLKR